MDEDSENSDEEKPTAAEDSDSDIPSDFEKEMAVDQDDDDEEEEEEDEENEEKLQQDIEQHKKDMEALKERDPEFYNFLQKEDDGLLGFGASDDEDEPEQVGGSDDEDADEGAYSDMEEPEEQDEKTAAVHVLKKAELNAWIEAVKSHKDFKAFKKLLSAFKTAARMSEEDDNVTFAYKIEDPTGNEAHRVDLAPRNSHLTPYQSFPRSSPPHCVSHLPYSLII